MRKYRSMQDSTVLVTGGGRGIGLATVRALARLGARVVMTATNRETTLPVCEALKKETGNSALELMELDLASQASVRDFSAAVSRNHPRLDVLINNAGVFSMKRQETPDGFEQTVAVNYLGPFLLTRLLLPALRPPALLA